MSVKFIVTPGGEKLAIMPAEEFEDMRDALIHQNAMADYRAGRSEALTIDEVRKLLEAPTPLAFWRAKRAVTSGRSRQGGSHDTAARRRSGIRKAQRVARSHVANCESFEHSRR